MKQKSLVLLGAAAVAAIALAAYSLHDRDASVVADSSKSAAGKEQDRLFPGLLEKVNDVATISIARHDGGYTLRKADDSWGLVEKDGFPVDIDPIRKILIAMGEMKRLDKKTDDPKFHATFGVEEPDAAGSKSALLTLHGKAGDVMARLIVGKEHESKGALMSNQRYVRIGGDPQTWLVQGTFDLKEKGVDWLVKEIVKVEKDRVRSVEVLQPDGDLLVIDRASRDLTDFTLLEIPDGKELTYPTAPGSVASGLEYVNLEDVEPIAKIDFQNTPGPVAKFKTFDGLVVTATIKDVDGKAWARFEAAYEAPAVPPGPTPAEGATPKPGTKSPEDVQKEVAELNARLGKWAYQISSYTRANLGKKKSELLKDKTPPPAPVDPNAPKDPNAPDKGAMFIPNTLPPEIQQQIKADQEARGNKVIIGTPQAAPKSDAPAKDAPPSDAPADGSTPAPTPTPAPHDPAHDHDHPHERR